MSTSVSYSSCSIVGCKMCIWGVSNRYILGAGSNAIGCYITTTSCTVPITWCHGSQGNKYQLLQG